METITTQELTNGTATVVKNGNRFEVSRIDYDNGAFSVGYHESFATKNEALEALEALTNRKRTMKVTHYIHAFNNNNSDEILCEHCAERQGEIFGNEDDYLICENCGLDSNGNIATRHDGTPYQ